MRQIWVTAFFSTINDESSFLIYCINEVDFQGANIITKIKAGIFCDIEKIRILAIDATSKFKEVCLWDFLIL